MRFIDPLGAGIESVDDDFEIGAAFDGDLLDQSICVTQFGNAELRDQVKGHGFVAGG